MGLSDRMLDRGCARHIEAAHGEPVKVLTGSDAGKTFTAVRENEPDSLLISELGDDRRAKRFLRFRNSGGVPRLNRLDIVQTEDGKKWNAVTSPQNAYLTTDFELTEITDKDTQ